MVYLSVLQTSVIWGFVDIALADYAGISSLPRRFPGVGANQKATNKCTTYYEIWIPLECGGHHHRFESLPPCQ